jgi:RimJ/RimL family protein N-acetyltransferase
MLKMHPDNFSARGVARKIGFQQTGVEERTGNLIYHLELKKRASRE